MYELSDFLFHVVSEMSCWARAGHPNVPHCFTQNGKTLSSVKKRKQLAYKPGSVLLHFCLRANVVQRLSFICACCCQQAIAVYPPARASSPQAPVYMTLQLPERTAQDVTIPTGGPLPHLLTLTSPERGGYFLLRQPCRHRHLAH